MFPPFVGARKPLDEFDVPMLAYRLDVGEDELRAFLEVEARSRGFDREGRPVMLFEPHVFYRNLDGLERDRAVQLGLAYRSWGEKKYPSDSYARLEAAVKINESAALMSCSIGLSQVLVENYSSLGYATPQEMWRLFMDDEQEHVEAMVKFILINGIADDLQAHNWDGVARVYNGPSYKKNRYAQKMAEAFRKFSKIKDVDWSPDSDVEGPGDETNEGVRAVQQKLRDIGYFEVGSVDGKWGTRTRAAVLAFRADNGLPTIPTIDEEFKAALMVGGHRSIAPTRRATTANDLAEAGSRSIKTSKKAEAGGVLLALGGGVTAFTDRVGDQIDSLSGLASKVAPFTDTLKDFGPYIVMGVGAFIIWQMWNNQAARVDDHQTGKNAGPR